MYFLLFLPVIFLVASVVLAIRAVKKGARRGRAVAVQMLSFALVCVACFAIPMIASAASNDNAVSQTVVTAQAPNDNNAGAQDVVNTDKGMIRMAAAVAMGVSGIGGGIAVAAAAPAAIGATSEDSKNFGKSLIFVALGEGIALYGLLISILILVL